MKSYPKTIAEAFKLARETGAELLQLNYKKGKETVAIAVFAVGTSASLLEEFIAELEEGKESDE